MFKLKKWLAIGMSTATLATCMVGGAMSASANTVTKSGIGTFSWDTSKASMTNISSTSRIVGASFWVYKDKTGTYVTQKSSSVIADNGDKATAKNPNSLKYTSNGYNFICSGSVYNSTNSNSGLAWSTGNKALD